MDPQFLFSYHGGFDAFAYLCDVSLSELPRSRTGEHGLTEVVAGQHSAVAYGVGLIAEVELFLLGGDGHDSEDKASQRGEQEQDGVAVFRARESVSNGPTEADVLQRERGSDGALWREEGFLPGERIGHADQHEVSGE